MSGKAKKTKVVQATSEVVVSPVGRHRDLHLRVVAIIAGCVVLLVIVIGGVIALSSSGTNDNTDRKQADELQAANNRLQSVAAAKPEGVQEEARALANKGDIDGAMSKLQAALDAATDDQDKHSLLVTQAVIELNAEQAQKALDLITQAEKYGDSRSSSDVGAMAAADLHQNVLAIEYYNKSLARIDKSDPNYYNDKGDIEKSIKALQ